MRHSNIQAAVIAADSARASSSLVCLFAHRRAQIAQSDAQSLELKVSFDDQCVKR
jgi:hypothetical protein